MTTTISDIYREYGLELFESAPREERAEARSSAKRRIHLICLECARSLMGYQANEFARLNNGTCGVCNRERRVADPKLFQLNLR